MTMFERAKKISERRGLSIAEVERRSNLSENYLYTWKKTDNPRTATVEAVAKTLGVTSDELLGTKHQPLVDEEPKQINVDDIINDSAMLTSHDHVLSAEDRAAIRALVKTYLDSKADQDRMHKHSGYENEDDKLEK